MALDDDIANLRSIALFEDFEIEALRLLTFSAETKLLRAGDALFRRGDASDGGFILTHGSIALEKHDDGRPAEKVLRPFTLIGEIALVTETTRPVTAIAREPATILKITRALFLRILEEFPVTATRVRARVATRLTRFAQESKFERLQAFVLTRFRRRTGVHFGWKRSHSPCVGRSPPSDRPLFE